MEFRILSVFSLRQQDWRFMA